MLDNKSLEVEQYGEIMSKKPADKNFKIFLGSVLLIGAAIAATAILNRTTSSKGTQDVRARASVTSLMRMTAIIAAVDESAGTATVNSIQFASSAPKNLQALASQGGEWTVTAAGNTNLASLRPGNRVEMQVNPTSFNIAEHALVAQAITAIR